MIGALLLLATACGNAATDAPVTPPPAPDPAPDPAPAPPPADVRLFKRSRPMMGTIYEVTVAGQTDAVAAPAVDAALDEIARLEDVLSEWRDTSEISRINASAGGDPVAVGPDTLAVVEAGARVSEWSGGAFDLSWAALRGVYDFRPGQGRVPPTAEVRRLLPLVDFRGVVIARGPPATVHLARRGMAIGTGGIGKGYALDRAGAILQAAGCESYMIFGGGQVQVHGLRGDRAWRVGVQHPRQADYFAFLEATEGSISTSGDYEHFFVDETGRRWHHIIDTDTGLPITHTTSVTMLAPDGLHADALSTACFVLGAERCLAMLARIPIRAEAVIVDAQLRVHTTPGTDARVHWTMERDATGRLP